MGVYQVGEVIRRTRESLGITQETLSEGICSVETLSRIENGKRMPSRANFEAIMERMGKPGEKYLPFIHDSNIQLHVMQREIARLLAIQDYEKTKRKLEQMEQLLDMDDHVNQQYVLRTKAIVRYRLGETSRL